MFNKLLGLGKKEEFFLELDEAKGVPTVTETPAPKAEMVAAVVAEVSTEAKATQKEAPATSAIVAAPAISTVVAKPTEVEFATKFFMVPTSRRLPGPSLNTFKTMAQEVKTRRG